MKTQLLILSKKDNESILKACKAAENADVVLLAIGESAFQTGEASKSN